MARYVKNPEALIARNTDINRSEPVATDLFFWNKKTIMKFLPVPSEMSKLEGITGCIITYSKSMDKAQLPTATFDYLAKS